MATDVRHDAPHDATNESMTGLLKGIFEDVEKLTAQQFQLLKKEVKDDVRNTASASTMLGVGAVVLMFGGLLLCFTLAYLLEWAFYPKLPLWGAFALVTGAVLAAGACLLFAGIKKFQSFNPLPDKTAEALKENVQWLTKNT
jgi:hypothetical protein